jgi:outer membrane protein OmpA-like peptidoglycan-associated protein
MRLLHIFGLLLVLWCPQGSYALSAQRFQGAFQVSFPNKSSVLDDAAMETLKKRLPKILGRSGLEVVIVIGYSDREDAQTGLPWQLGLATARARAIEKFFVDSGLPRERIYSEGRVVGDQPSYDNPSRQDPAGTAEVEYLGTCNIKGNCGPVDRPRD